MKVLLNANTSFYIETFRKGLIYALKRRGYEPIVVAPEDEFTDGFRYEVSFYTVNNLRRSSINPVHDLNLLAEYLHLFRRVRPDIIVNFTIKPNVYGSIAARRLRIPCISVVSGLGYAFMQDSFLKRIASFLYKIGTSSNDYVIFENEDDLNSFVSEGIIDSSKAVLVDGAGVDLEFFVPPSATEQVESLKANVFLYMGRLLWDKGLHELVEATRFLKEEGLSFEVWLVGAIDVNNKSGIPENVVKIWENEGLIKYLGYVKDVRNLISKASCVILPSHREGIPRSLLEAMAMGKPIITTQVPGCRETVCHGVNGFLAEPNNPESLAAAMKAFLSLSVQRKIEMGIQSRSMAEKRFDEKKVIEKYLEVIEAVYGTYGKKIHKTALYKDQIGDQNNEKD
ncbi:MAG TPA: glycosyltransferase family 4 protein [Clostridiales bacterium]|nr:glycosyltransferase family 4 protein [Clostridiales bacterium]